MNSTLFCKTFRRLIAWKEAHRLTLDVYRATKIFPSDEKFGVTSQMRRAASSIAAQIAEGSQMPTGPHRTLYYERAYASAAEVDYFLELSKDLGYLETGIYDALLGQVNRVSFLVHRLAQSKYSPSLPSIRSLPSAPQTSFS